MKPNRRHSLDLDEEGVTRYQLEYKKGDAVSASFIREINAWRTLFHALEWIGQDPKRYRGVGFGNISRRVDGQSGPQGAPVFVVSGTQTGSRPRLAARDYATVLNCRPVENLVFATGPVAPSSESMTHAMIYTLDPTAHVVIHVHAPILWTHARELRLPMTRPHVRYGTPEMAREVERLFRNRRLRRLKIFSMAGHRDGVVSFGKTAEEAGRRLIDYALRAYR